MNLKLRLIILNFLQFAVWGAYLTSMGNYLGAVGLGSKIGLFLCDAGNCFYFYAGNYGDYCG